LLTAIAVAFALVAIFRRTAVPTHVRTIAEAESLANDGVAVSLAGGAAFSLGGALATAAAALVAGIGLARFRRYPSSRYGRACASHRFRLH